MNRNDATVSSNDASTDHETEAGGTERGVGYSRRNFLRGSGALVGAGASAGVLSGVAGAQEERRDVMFTANTGDGTVTMIDAETYDVVGTVDLYPDNEKDELLQDALQSVATEIINALARENYVEHVNISPDGRTLYAARGHVGDVVAIDIESNEKLWEHNLAGFRADHQVLSPDGRWVYTADIMFDKIVKIHAPTGWKVWSGSAHTWPHGLHIHRLPAFGGDQVLINGSIGTVITPEALGKTRLTFMDPRWMYTRRTVDFRDGVRPFVVSHDGRKIYLQISKFHGFHEYDIDRDEVTRTVELPQTEHVPEDEGDYPLQSAHHGIDMSGDGEHICVAGTTSWYAAIVRRSDLSLVDTIHVGKHPYWVRTAPDGRHAFVGVRGEDYVSVINYRRAEEVARVPAGKAPMVVEPGAVPESIL